jgi:diguanylate cyclase (GGDEF)-like protein
MRSRIKSQLADGQAGVQGARDNVITGYRRLSLRAELATGFAAVIVLTLVVGFVSLFAQNRAIEAVNKLVAVVGRIADLSLRSDVAMLKARRAEKDFLIFQSEFGFEEARSRYTTLLRTSVAEVRQRMADLRELSSEQEVIQLTRSIDQAVDRYEAGFLRVVDLYGLRGQVTTGFEGNFLERARAIEAILGAANHDRLMVDLLSLRRDEKDFLARGNDKDVEAFAKDIDQFKADLALARLSPEVKGSLLGLMADYQRSFGQYVKTRATIDAEQTAYLAAAHTVEPLLEKLSAIAELNAHATRNDAEREAQIAVWAICAAALLASLLGLAVALIISRSITKSVEECLGFASRVAQGDLSTRLSPRGESEFGTLAVALNRMTEVLEERDAELSRSNILLQQEVQQHQLAAGRAEYLAYYDSLTTLPNRSMFSKLLNHAISLARRDGTQLAVLFVDLDRFKNINDTLGHEAGDLLLQEVGKRLQGCLRESDTVARLGGDEFVILLPALGDGADVEVVAHKILAATSKSFVALGQEFRVTASVGVSTYPKDGDDEQSLMKNADIAMYQAKEEGKNNFQYYSVQMNTNSFERLALESSLRRALEHDEFRLHYQPKIDARSDRIVGVEALLRWQHPELGMVAPTKFLPVAEETGLIVSIGKWVLKTACTQNVAWQQRGLPHLNIAVNLSRRQFSDEGLLRDITAILEETGMSPDLLELEITESTLMHDVDKAMRTLKAFRDMGVRLAIDNFGAGYSSLSNLRRFPVDTIKIDGSFIRDLSNDAENRGIAETIIATGKTLSLTIVAECVETKAQADFLRERACDEFQGFYFSKAVTAGKFVELLEAQTMMAAEEA